MNSASLPGPKRLIEVDLPIRKISEHARREKSIRHGHISTLHLWWARRPLAACRAVILASLWPDPADRDAPATYRKEAAQQLGAFRATRGGKRLDLNDPEVLRGALLEFIADFANWDHATNSDFLAVARAITAAAGVEAWNGAAPVVLDPFAGGGAIPFEASRIGAEPFASDLNPVAVLLNKVAIEYVPRFGQALADDVRHWGAWVLDEARKELAALYPPGFKESRAPIAYLWARTIRCEGPSCGAEIPLVRSYVLARKGARHIALAPSVDQKAKSIKFSITHAKAAGADGTVRSGSAECPVCGYTTPNARVRAQLAERRGGAESARLLAVVTTRPGEQGRQYRIPEGSDLEGAASAVKLAERLRRDGAVPLDPIPTERPSPNARGMSAVTRMGVETFADLFAPRQLVAIATFARLVREASLQIQKKHDRSRAEAICTCLALAVDRIADACSSLATWSNTGEFIRFTFARQALAIVWDFAECNPLADASGNWAGAIEWIGKAVDVMALGAARGGTVHRASATKHPLPDDSVDAVITDPPYYDAVPYADLSEYFFVWLKQSLRSVHPDLLDQALPKDDEAIWNPSRIYSVTGKPKDERFYENQMRLAFVEARRVAKPNGIAVVVFAHKSTAGWEAVLGALLDAGWVATASWPIDTERSARTNAIGTASLASSVHIVCRPRETSDGQLAVNTVGDWREVLHELPQRIHEWLPRLAEEGIVGADAIFACLGPGLEVFSRYARVEKVSGEVVLLREYLEHVWAAVSREALSMIFDAAETTGLEEDARLTAMWLWTLAAPGVSATDTDNEADDETAADGENEKSASGAGFLLDFDAARKIAQGLGARLDELIHVVEVKGDKARLLAVSERAKHLFGKSEGVPTAKKSAKKKQMTLFGELEEAAATQGWGEVGAPKAGTTTLDRVHQAMLLFGSGRGEALKRFLVEEGVGKQAQFWMLAQSLSALYPSGSDEKRWVDGVVARKKGLGFG